MIIKLARPEDASAIAALIERATLPHKDEDFDESGWRRFAESNSERGILAKLTEVERFTLVAGEGDQIVGLVSVTGGDKIDLLFVCPHHRRKGVANDLWCAVRSQIVPRSGAAFWVRSSSAGVPFYKRQGFAIEGGRQSAAGISFYLMKLSVNKLLNGGDAAGSVR